MTEQPKQPEPASQPIRQPQQNPRQEPIITPKPDTSDWGRRSLDQDGIRKK